MTNRYSHIIWDWNGTLLNDVDWCIGRVNKMLSKRNKQTLRSRSEYHAAFCFPIIEYYKNVGFDFDEEPFEQLAQEYIDLYHAGDNSDVGLHDHVESVLQAAKDHKLSQIILSASAQDNLMMQLSPFGLGKYFDEVLGIADIYAKSKVEIGLDYVRRNNIQNGVLVGDTTHDFEVAQAIGVDCILVAHGHQSRQRLASCNVPMFDNLRQVRDYVLVSP